MNILFYLIRYPGIGGIETVTRLIANQLKNSYNVNITILSFLQQGNCACSFAKILKMPNSKEWCARENYDFADKVIAGGKERFESVSKGLKVCDKRNKIVMIHDAARPCVTNRMILDSISGARRYKACTVAMPVKDTIKIVNEEGFGVETPDRNTVYQIQTPQTFDRKLLEEAYDRLRISGDRDITDDTMIVERYMDVQSKMIEGSYENFKVTTPEDIRLAELFL